MNKRTQLPDSVAPRRFRMATSDRLQGLRDVPVQATARLSASTSAILA